MSTITAQIQLRRDTSANWTSNNPILLAGEMALSTDVLYSGTDQPRYKIGNGVDTWLNLDYVPEGGGGGSQDLQSVTNLGATTTNAINTAGITSDYLQLDTTATPTNAIGKLVWNDSLGTAEIGLKGGSINAKLAQDLYARVVNKTGSNLLYSQSKVVKVSTAQGQRLAVALAQANNDLNSADTIGLVAENINNNQEGFVITVGQLTGLNTTGSLQGETWADGDVLYLSPTTAGAITKVKPDGSTGHIVVLGYVEYAHQNNGKIYVKIMNGWELDELHNVYINQGTLANNDALIYESSTQLWKNKQIGYTLLFTAGANLLISPADATTYYFGSGRNSIYTPDHAVIIPKAGTLKSISFFHVVNSTLGTAENSTLSVQVRNTGYSGSVSTTTQITNTYKFNTTYNSTMFTGLNIDLPEGCAVDIKWLTPTWVTNPAQIQINATLFIV
jgi:hypothetical protein